MPTHWVWEKCHFWRAATKKVELLDLQPDERCEQIHPLSDAHFGDYIYGEHVGAGQNSRCEFYPSMMLSTA